MAGQVGLALLLRRYDWGLVRRKIFVKHKAIPLLIWYSGDVLMKRKPGCSMHGADSELTDQRSCKWSHEGGHTRVLLPLDDNSSEKTR